MSERTKGISGVGAITVVTVLLVLCMTVFAVLTFVSSQAELRIAQKNAENVSAFYAADALGSQLIARAAAGADAEALNKFAPDSGCTLSDENGLLILRASLPVDDSRRLDIEVAVNLADGPEIRVWKLNTPSDEDTISDEQLELWPGL